MSDSAPLVLKRPSLDLRSRLEASGAPPSQQSVFRLLLAAVFAAAASMSFLAVVILGAPGRPSGDVAPSEVRLPVASGLATPLAPTPLKPR